VLAAGVEDDQKVLVAGVLVRPIDAAGLVDYVVRLGAVDLAFDIAGDERFRALHAGRRRGRGFHRGGYERPKYLNRNNPGCGV
jgi:hypothetical protein